MSNSLANGLVLHGTALKLTVKDINTEVIDTKMFELTVTLRDNEASDPSGVSPYVKEKLNVGADAINLKPLPRNISAPRRSRSG